MYIDVLKLKKEVAVLDKKIDYYESIILNMYNDISKLSTSWQDVKSRRFFSECLSEKKDLKTTVLELSSIKEIYSYIVDRYRKFGKSVTFNLKEYDSIIGKFNSYIEKLQEIINLYVNLDTSFCPIEKKYVDSHCLLLKKEKSEIVGVKNNYKKLMREIIEIEKDISNRFNKINIAIIKEKSIKYML